MALRGSLKDFGIADVFSLIGSQNKSGTLAIEGKDEKIQLHFLDGSVIFSTNTGRRRKDLLGNMLVRSEIITPEQLATALSQHKAHGRYLGEELVAMGAATAAELQDLAKLQSTETVYRAFLWRSGTYEFAQAESAPDVRHPPLRAESLLMEGFRQADEWPELRQKLTSYATVFTTTGSLDALLAAAPTESADELDFDLAMGDEGEKKVDPSLRRIGAYERLVYSLIDGQRDVQKLIDLSRLGEFDTCKALLNLLGAGIIAARGAVRGAAPAQPSAEATVGGIKAPRSPAGELAVQVAWAVAMAIAWLIFCQSGLGWSAASTPRRAVFLDMHLENQLGRGTQLRLEHALKIYRATHGEYPETLNALVQADLLSSKDLQFPWQKPYYYGRNEGGYLLARPLF